MYMTYDVSTVNDYIAQLSENRKSAIKKLEKTILDNLPESFEEGVTYKMKATMPRAFHLPKRVLLQP